MDAKNYKWLAPFILTFSINTYADEASDYQSMDYEYLYAEVSAGSLDEYIGVNSDVSSFVLGGHYQVMDDLFVTLEYEARYIHPDETTTEIYTLLPGAFYRYEVVEGLDFLAGMKTGLLWAHQTNNETDKSISKDNRFMITGSAALRYNISENWDVEGSAEIRRSDVLDEEVYILRGDYFLTARISLGGFYKHRHKDTATTNEGGLSMRFYY
tara:strand:+ start:597 stop:1232 length:636 start_codon:yes stop_codon:yes gene_type:complete